MIPGQPDKHTIETPEQIPLEFAVAGVGSRFLALALDTMIQGGIGAVVFLVAGVLGVLSGVVQQPLWIVAGLIALAFLLTFGYFVAFEIAWNGQTPGKRVVGIRVVKDSGRPLAPAESVARNFMRIVDQLPGFYAVGMTVALLNSRNKRLGDFVAGSLVVRETSLAQIRPIWQTAMATQPPPLPQAGAAQLSMEDLALIDAFLHRRHDLAPDVRSRMAGEILLRIRSRVPVQVEVNSSPEAILEALAYGRRSAGG